MSSSVDNLVVSLSGNHVSQEPSTTMQLKDLTQNTPKQTARVNELLEGGFLTPEHIPHTWTQFWESIWGSSQQWEGLQEVKRDEVEEARVEDSCIPLNALPVNTLVMNIPGTLPVSWTPESKQILVRSEYHEAEKTALLASEDDRDALLVTGHPGIGLPSSCPCYLHNLTFYQGNHPSFSGFSSTISSSSFLRCYKSPQTMSSFSMQEVSPASFTQKTVTFTSHCHCLVLREFGPSLMQTSPPQSQQECSRLADPSSSLKQHPLTPHTSSGQENLAVNAST